MLYFGAYRADLTIPRKQAFDISLAVLIEGEFGKRTRHLAPDGDPKGLEESQLRSVIEEEETLVNTLE